MEENLLGILIKVKKKNRIGKKWEAADAPRSADSLSPGRGDAGGREGGGRGRGGRKGRRETRNPDGRSREVNTDSSFLSPRTAATSPPLPPPPPG